MNDQNPSDTSTEDVGTALDMSVVASLKELGGEDDPGLFTDLVETFLADTPQRVRAIETAARDADAEGLMKAAHGLKSSAANLGAARLSALCRELEKAGRGGALEGVDRMAARLVKEYAAAEKALRQASAT
ncbi:MAG: Hpt domain-containing protein [Planctomycetes bacterium]|nr:Hpt domain-containing protein [Planctomycetota bacterium]